MGELLKVNCIFLQNTIMDTKDLPKTLTILTVGFAAGVVAGVLFADLQQELLQEFYLRPKWERKLELA